MNTFYRLIWNTLTSARGGIGSYLLLCSATVFAETVDVKCSNDECSGAQEITLPGDSEVVTRLKSVINLDATTTGNSGHNAWFVKTREGTTSEQNRVVIDDDTNIRGGGNGGDSDDGNGGNALIAGDYSLIENSGSISGGQGGSSLARPDNPYTTNTIESLNSVIRHAIKIFQSLPHLYDKLNLQ